MSAKSPVSEFAEMPPAKRAMVVPKKVIMVFLDVVDFDNWEALFLLLKQHDEVHDEVHIVVTSRAFDAELAPAKVDFRTKKVVVDRGGVKQPEVDTATFFKDVKAKADQPVNHADSLKLVEMHLEFMDNHLKKAGFTKYKLFNGGYAPEPGLTSDIHKLCHLFPNAEGTDFCTAAEYKAREAEWFEWTPAQRRTMFDSIAVTKEFPNVDGMVAKLRESDGPIAAWFLGPMTAAAQVFFHQDLRDRFEEAYVMGSCWDATGKSNLLGVCFNYGVDMAAALFVLAALSANPNCRTLFVPTETTKNAVVPTFCREAYLGEKVQSTMLREGRTFWNDIKGGPQPPYDAAACVPSEKFVEMGVVAKVEHAMNGAMALTEVAEPTAVEAWAAAKGFYAVKNPDTPEKCQAVKDALVESFHALFAAF
jgi:hypothetical protein